MKAKRNYFILFTVHSFFSAMLPFLLFIFLSHHSPWRAYFKRSLM